MQLSKKQIVLYGAIAAVLIGGACLLAFNRTAEAPIVEQTGTQEPTLAIELADTPAKQVQGLSGRREVPDNYGMLFVFPRPSRHGFWMKDMLVPIDIIWLSDSGAIVGIEHSVSPNSYPTVFYAPQPVRFVLETRAGYADDHGWEIGTQVPISLP
jgi:uncharacterized protein